uniref:Uncharacterized protein n=1 Tax=Romanomermis culicivorax TaxID=13658 RepID=A0A915K4X6_ROMCU
MNKRAEEKKQKEAIVLAKAGVPQKYQMTPAPIITMTTTATTQPSVSSCFMLSPASPDATAVAPQKKNRSEPVISKGNVKSAVIDAAIMKNSERPLTLSVETGQEGLCPCFKWTDLLAGNLRGAKDLSEVVEETQHMIKLVVTTLSITR